MPFKKVFILQRDVAREIMTLSSVNVTSRTSLPLSDWWMSYDWSKIKN